jgi:hypothetical protein
VGSRELELAELILKSPPEPWADTARITPAMRLAMQAPPQHFLARPWRFDMAMHPCLSRYLPGVEFFKFDPPGSWGNRHVVLALCKGKLYGLAQFEQLLVDVGYALDSSEVPAIAKVAVLWMLMRQQIHPHGNPPRPRPDTAALAIAVPAVTFKKVAWGDWQGHRYVRHFRAVKISMDVAGKPTTVWMIPRGRSILPDCLQLYGVLQWFRWG